MTVNELKDAIKVIKAAKKLGVISMKLGTLEFVLSNEPRVSRSTLKVSAKTIAKQDEKNELQMKLGDSREALSTMHVEDPLGFEDALIQKVLSDDNGGDDIEETFGS